MSGPNNRVARTQRGSHRQPLATRTKSGPTLRGGVIKHCSPSREALERAYAAAPRNLRRLNDDARGRCAYVYGIAYRYPTEAVYVGLTSRMPGLRPRLREHWHGGHVATKRHELAHREHPDGVPPRRWRLAVVSMSKSLTSPRGFDAWMSKTYETPWIGAVRHQCAQLNVELLNRNYQTLTVEERAATKAARAKAAAEWKEGRNLNGCTPSCMTAIGDDCNCPCNGVYHGTFA